MLPSIPSFEISPPQIVVVAGGDTSSAKSHNKGHLFEKFIAKLFEAYGCEPPSVRSLNVRANGYELDLVTRFTLSDARAIAECKAYTSALPSAELNAFYGKLSVERLDNADTFGWFVAIPGLTKDGFELARKLEAQDSKFKLITSLEIQALVHRKGWVPKFDEGEIQISDEAILVTSSGLCALAKQLDPNTHLPISVLVKRMNGVVNSADLALLADSDYCGGLAVVDVAVANNSAPYVVGSDAPNLFTVVGSSADFEYQFPAAPKYFIGREDVLAKVGFVGENKGQARVIVLNAQSGWGKSSLALRLADQVRGSGGFAIVYDTRTAGAASYVAASIRKALTEAVQAGKLEMPSDPSFASLRSSLATLQAAYRMGGSAPMLIFFDQFENVFRNSRITQEFRDLAIGVREIEAPITIGFSWKTDLFGLTEGYPYQLRDEIRGSALVLSIDPFGPSEVNTLLARLGKASHTKLSNDLRQRLREYSQGLPWLLKKLGNHILTQLQAGVSESELLSEALNIERLFDQDLANLETREVDAIKVIAKEAPVAVAEIIERVSPEIIQSLVDQRLLVRVGERLDTYWDTFREFLISGKVAIEDTYILRQWPLSTANLLTFLVRNGGEMTTPDVVRELGTSSNVIFNASRDLRQLGILAQKPGVLVMVDSLRGEDVTENHIRARVNKSLRRHKIFSCIRELAMQSKMQQIETESLAQKMPSLFPAVDVSEKTWRIYTAVFVAWLEYAGLLQVRGRVLILNVAPATGVRLLGVSSKNKSRTFPQSRPSAAIRLLESIVIEGSVSLTPSMRKANADLQSLGVIGGDGNILNQQIALQILDVQTRSHVLTELVSKLPGASAAILLVREHPDSKQEDIGAILEAAYSARWEPDTAKKAGSMFKAWVASMGVDVKRPKKATPQKSLLFDAEQKISIYEKSLQKSQVGGNSVVALPDLMNALTSFKQAYSMGAIVLQSGALQKDIYVHLDKPNGQPRLTYVRLDGKEVVALITYIQCEPVEGVPCYNVGWAVSEGYRRKGIAASTLKASMAELRAGLMRNKIPTFYVEAIVGVDNLASQGLAQKVISQTVNRGQDSHANVPVLQYLKKVDSFSVL